MAYDSDPICGTPIAMMWLAEHVGISKEDPMCTISQSLQAKQNSKQ